MKKILVYILLPIAIVLLFAACNKNILPGSYEYHMVHICDNSGKAIDLEISSWKDDNSDTGVEVKLKNGNSIFCSEGTYILCEDYCPLCNPNGVD